MGFKQWVLASLFYKSCLFACLLCLLILTGSDSNFSCPLGRPSSCICVPYILPSPTYGAKLPTKAWAYEWLGACKCYWQHTTASSKECEGKFVLQVLLACLLACLLAMLVHSHGFRFEILLSLGRTDLLHLRPAHIAIANLWLCFIKKSYI